MSMNLRSFILRTTLSLFTLSTVVVLWQLFVFGSIPKENDVEYQQEFNDNYKIFSLTLPSTMDFCGEKVPLEKITVRESLDRELLVNTYWQSNSILHHKRANRWLPLITKVLKENDVPEDMKYIALIESGLTNVISPAGATGFWQFLKRTGQEYGLEINTEVDERYHVLKSTEAACRYLKVAYDKFGSWTLAAASYNMGISGIEKQLKRQQTQNYYELLLVEETARYVFRALALKEIMSDPERYGFHIRKKDLYPTYKTRIVEINRPVPNFATFAKKQGIDYLVLKTLNPWLRDNFLTNKLGKTYLLELPAESFNDAPNE